MITYNTIGTHGRFGNQMFQYAALYSIAKTRKYQFGVPYKLKTENGKHKTKIRSSRKRQ